MPLLRQDPATKDWVIIATERAQRPGACFARLTDAALVDLAEVLRLMLRKLYVGLGNPDYNCVVQTAPIQDEDKDYFLWHLQILPRLNRAAGFELGSGMFINTALPGETAAFIREVEA